MAIFAIFEQFPETFPILKTAISAFVAFILGILWYHPKVMGEQLQETGDVSRKNFNPNIFVYLVAFLLWGVAALIYSFLTSFLTPPKIQELLGLSTFLWVGFVLPPILMNGLMTGRKLMVSAIDSSYFLAGLYLFAVIHDVL